MNIDFTVSLPFSGQRLDQVLCQAVPGCSRSMAARAVTSGAIRVSGLLKRPGYRTKPGDQVTGEILEKDVEIKVESDPRTLDVVYADSHIVVLNKPPGMVVHPGAGCHENTLVNRLVHHFPEIRQIGEDPDRPGIVHRLDKDTSGLILAARTPHSLTFLQKEFKYHRVEKIYLALAEGADLADSGEIDRPIGRHSRHRKRMCVSPDTGRPARTSWQVIRRFSDTCLVRVRLHTGRTHQIRVHFYDMGHPLLGDPVYQFRRNRKADRSCPRQMLHAWQMGFRHPFSGQKIWLETEPPRDFMAAVATAANISLEPVTLSWEQIMGGGPDQG